MSNAKNIIILSEKSSGSSACQNLLARFANIRHVEKTRHFENETLFWTKAASLLEKPQLNMVDSEVPLSQEKAKTDLISMLTDNLDEYTPPKNHKRLITDGWTQLCKHYSPIFLEKSPHHLCQWSAIELIVETIQQINDVDFLLIGLVRNPMDTIYSQFKRWKSSPEQIEKQWRTAYQNLQRLQRIEGIQLVTVRYEDVVSSLSNLAPVFDFCDVKINAGDESYLHQKSLNKWKHDKTFGFSLSNETIKLAEMYGYQKSDLMNDVSLFRKLRSKSSRIVYSTLKSVKQLKKTR